MGTTVKGVGVDKGAVSKHDPVTVVVTPEGYDMDADTWTDANNYVSAGCAVKDGYPSYPGEEVTEAATSRQGPAPSSQRSGQLPGSGSPQPSPTPSASA